MGKVDIWLGGLIMGGSMDFGISLCGIVGWDGFGKWVISASMFSICVLKDYYLTGFPNLSGYVA